jgi:addiction module HigA family antidote
MTNSKNIQTPGEFVREQVLLPKNMTVKEAAQIVGVGRPAFSNFINGNSALSPDMASRIERAFGIPAQKLHDLQVSYDLAQAKTKGAPANTNIYVPTFLDIRANEIEIWSSSINARSRLSVFLRTLVHSTGIGLTKVDFPGNDDSERPGWDGFVMASEGTPWIPEGNSGWEFGCNNDAKTKADKDYQKNVRALGESERENITFIFVTPTRWTGKEKWAKEQQAKSQWKDVRVYDSSDLEQWVSQSIAGQTWFASETQLPRSQGTRSLDKCWADWSAVASPPLTGTLFKNSVENARSIIKYKLTKPPEEPIKITADSTEEAIAFLSELFNDKAEDLINFRDRVVVFNQPGVLPKLAAGASTFIAVAATKEVERELAPYCRSIHSIVVYPHNTVNIEPHIQLEPLSYEAFHSAFEEMGYQRDQIDRLEAESGRSLTVLYRRLSKVPAVRTPPWATDKNLAPCIVPFLFAGAWSDINKCDQSILSSLANEVSYATLEKQLQEISQYNDSPVWSLGTYRGVVSKIDLLFAVCGTITKSEIERYFQVAKLVLSEDDPSLDLPEKHRPFASLYGKTREISGPLRKGICETLVLLAVYGNGLFQKRLGINIEDMAENLIQELLDEPLTTRKLETHDRDLPTYAEVAPDAFLKILEKDLKNHSPAILGLMRPADFGIFGGGCPRTGLLWALENLAWSPSTLMKAALILAKLAEIKIEDNWANKPISSLNAIFRSWMPQTAATIDQRIAVLQRIIHDFPKIGWEVCMEQFSHRQGMGSYSHKPRWRNDGYGFGAPVKTHGEMYAFIARIIDIVLNWKHHDKSTVGDLIGHVHDLSDEHQELVWNIVKNWASTASDTDKAWVREKIRVNFMSRRGTERRKKRKSDKIDVAAKVAYDALQPTDIINKYEWLFRQSWVEESYDELYGEEVDFRKREERITNMRSDALQAIMKERGIEGILSIAEMGKASLQIGILMSTRVLSANDITNFILKITELGDKFDSWTYKNLVRGSLQSIKDDQIRTDILNKLRNVHSSEYFIKLLELAPFCTATWLLVKEMEETFQQQYWQSVSPDWWHHSDEELNEIVEQLLLAQRPRAAFSCVHYKLENLRPALLYKLMNVLAGENNEAHGTYQLQPYDIEQAFEFLDSSDSFSIEEMAGLELAYVDILSRQWGSKENRGIPNLEKYIEKHPEFFAQVVAWLYKRKDGKTDPKEIRLEDPIQAQHRAERAYKLIEGLQRIPGRNNQDEIDRGQLLEWVSKVRKSCEELGRLDVGDLSLGKLFSEASEGVDGVWPCEPVRDVLEQIQSEEISRGLTIGLHNARGVHWRGEGGEQERELAKMYRKWASALEFSHPFVSTTILKDMAKDYERQAEREDTEAGIRRRLK